jgi:hypothetical protein
MDPTFEKYLDIRFKGLEQLICSNHKHNISELAYIREITEKTNGTVVAHEKRIRDLENTQNKCKIHEVVEDVAILKEETKVSRAWGVLRKGGVIMMYLAAVSIILGVIFNVVSI